MKPAPFDYLAPRHVDEALLALREHGLDAKLLAGGQSLIPLLNMRLTRPKIIIDLNRVSGLDHIRASAQGVTIGAMARQSTVERAAIVREKCSLLAEAIRHIGHLAIRHRGTIGGSLAHADPAAELPAVALALDAKFEVVSGAGTRIIAAREFFLDYLTTAVEPDEILREIVFPTLPPRSGSAVQEMARRHGDFAVAGAVATVHLDAEGRIADSRIALFGVAPTALRARSAEQELAGRIPTDRLIADAAARLANTLDPPGDIRASGAYRKHAAAVLTARALTQAIQRCSEAPLT